MSVISTSAPTSERPRPGFGPADPSDPIADPQGSHAPAYPKDTAPTVLVVLVAHDGAAWLPRTLDALAAQSYPSLEVVAVDNASADGSRELLLDRLGEEHVLVSDRDIGFGAAVAMALDSAAFDDAPYLLTLHDDCALAADAVEHLVRSLEADPRLAAVGPKLRAWDRPDRLQSVGCTIDPTGRADSGADPDELDQGQHDTGGQALYVPTTAMLVRRSAFDAVGRFDPRFHVFRDDLDLCWRLWLAGHEVEVVPGAAGEHAAGAANYLRLGQTRFIGPRYFAERNTLAALLKNYGAARLLVVLPLYVLVGIAKIAGFLLTRRFSDAWQTVRAWAWNVVHLLETRRYRREVQASRARTDRELARLFGRIGPRLRAYAEAMASWVAGGDVAAAAEPRDTTVGVPAERRSLVRRSAGLVQRRPVLLATATLTTLFVVGIWPLLLPGELRGGEFAAWPASGRVFLSDYVAAWHTAGTFGTSADPSPAQAMLGILQTLLGGSPYLTSRVLLLAPFAAAWLFTLRATQSYSRRRLTRVVAATAYVLSPPAFAALNSGRLGALIAFAAFPGLLAGGIAFARRSASAAHAWRAVAAVALLGAVAGAFEPFVLVANLIVGTVATGLRLLVSGDRSWRIALLARSAVAVGGPFVLLMPWSLDVLSADGPFSAPATEVAGDPLWRWLLLAPDLVGFPGLLAGAGFVLAGLLGLVLSLRRRPVVVLSLWGMAIAGATTAWWLDRTLAATWAGVPLFASAAAFAGLFAVAFATGEAQLARHAFGWRQLVAVTTVVAVSSSLGLVAVRLVADPFDAYAVDDPPLPSFVTAAARDEGPFRVLLLADVEGVVAWDVVDGEGPTMASYGVPRPAAASTLVDRAVRDLLSGRDPGAADRLGLLGVRYLLVPEGGVSPELDAALLGQTGVEPRPIPTGRLLAINGWMPSVAVVAQPDAAEISARAAVPAGTAIEPLDVALQTSFEALLREPSAILMTEVADPGWRAQVGGQSFEPADDALLRFEDLPAGRVSVSHAGATARGLAVTGQLLLVLLTVSLALRPPGFARSFRSTEPEGRA